jgi:hypothetical protein
MLTRLRSISEGKKEVIRGACFLVPFYVWAWRFFSGVVRWPYLPIRAISGQFVDKRGHLFSLEEYTAFQKWDSNLSTRYGFIVAFASAAAASWILDHPLWSQSFAPESSPASERFRRMFPRIMIGVSMIVFLLLAWELLRR